MLVLLGPASPPARALLVLAGGRGGVAAGPRHGASIVATSARSPRACARVRCRLEAARRSTDADRRSTPSRASASRRPRAGHGGRTPARAPETRCWRPIADLRSADTRPDPQASRATPETGSPASSHHADPAARATTISSTRSRDQPSTRRASRATGELVDALLDPRLDPRDPPPDPARAARRADAARGRRPAARPRGTSAFELRYAAPRRLRGCSRRSRRSSSPAQTRPRDGGAGGLERAGESARQLDHVFTLLALALDRERDRDRAAGPACRRRGAAGHGARVPRQRAARPRFAARSGPCSGSPAEGAFGPHPGRVARRAAAVDGVAAAGRSGSRGVAAGPQRRPERYNPACPIAPSTPTRSSARSSSWRGASRALPRLRPGARRARARGDRRPHRRDGGLDQPPARLAARGDRAPRAAAGRGRPRRRASARSRSRSARPRCPSWRRASRPGSTTWSTWRSRCSSWSRSRRASSGAARCGRSTSCARSPT